MLYNGIFDLLIRLLQALFSLFLGAGLLGCASLSPQQLETMSAMVEAAADANLEAHATVTLDEFKLFQSASIGMGGPTARIELHSNPGDVNERDLMKVIERLLGLIEEETPDDPQ